MYSKCFYDLTKVIFHHYCFLLCVSGQIRLFLPPKSQIPGYLSSACIRLTRLNIVILIIGVTSRLFPSFSALLARFSILLTASKNSIPLSYIHSFPSIIISPRKWTFSKCIFLTFQHNLSKNTIYDLLHRSHLLSGLLPKLSPYHPHLDSTLHNSASLTLVLKLAYNLSSAN